MVAIKPEKRGIILVAILLLLGLAVVYFSFDPENSKFFPPCLFYKITGLKCPGCGTQRTIHSLLHGDFKQAFFYNPAFFVAIPLVILLIYMEYFGGKNRFSRLHYFLSSTKFIFGLLIAILLYWIGRNIF